MSIGWSAETFETTHPLNNIFVVLWRSKFNSPLYTSYVARQEPFTATLRCGEGSGSQHLPKRARGPGPLSGQGMHAAGWRADPWPRASCTPPHPLAPPHHCTLIIPHCCTLPFCQSSVIYSPHTILVMDAPPETRLRLAVFMEAVSLIISSECCIVLVNTAHCL